MKKMITIVGICFLVIVISLGLQSCGGKTARSRNWKVTLHSLKLIRNAISANSNFLYVELEVQYIGEDGKVTLPLICLKRASGEQLIANQGEIKGPFNEKVWRALAGDTQQHFDLKKGEKLDPKPFTALFEIPTRREILELVVGDIQPIPIEPPAATDD